MNQTGSLAAPICASLQHIAAVADVQSSIVSLAGLLEAESVRARRAFAALREAPRNATWQAELAHAAALLQQAHVLLYGAATDTSPPARRIRRGVADADDGVAPLLMASRHASRLARALLAEAAARLDRFSAAIQ